MAKLLDVIGAAGKPLLWLDDTAYVDRLLAGGKMPWLAAAELVALRRKAIGLLKPDVNVVPVGAITHAWAGSNAALKDSMASKKRAVVPARTLLADEPLRKHLIDVVQGLRAAFGSMPMVLQLPSPRALVSQAYRLAFGDAAEVEVGEDEADSCAVYMAEFLRSFGELGVDGLLLVEAPGAEPADASELEWYQPVINVAGHYRWDLGVELPGDATLDAAPSGFQFVIASSPIAGVVRGQRIDEAFWSGEVAPQTTERGFLFTHIPAEAVPETVLERLGALRQ